MIEIKNYTKEFGKFSLKDISLKIEENEYLVILGPSGCGKTMLLESIAGLHFSKQGKFILGAQCRDVTNEPPENRLVALVYQNYALFKHLSIRENIGYGLRYLKMSRSEQDDRVDEMIDLLNIDYLADRSNPVGLSGGESQKVALARALAIDPDILLLDEPLSSLDYQSRQHVMDVFKRIKRKTNIPVIHVTHDYTEALSLADYIAVMRNGAIEQFGKVDDVFWRPKNRFVAAFLGISNVFDIKDSKRQDGYAVVKTDSFKLKVLHKQLNRVDAICFRPEDIRVHTLKPEMDNILCGRLREATDLGFSVRLLVDVDLTEIVSIIPRNVVSNLGITIDSEVYLEIPKDDIHLLAAGAAMA